MGRFDSIMAKCPNCGKENEFQSKGGDCQLQYYRLEDCPDDVLSNANRHSPVKCECGLFYQIDIVNRKPISTYKAWRKNMGIPYSKLPEHIKNKIKTDSSSKKRNKDHEECRQVLEFPLIAPGMNGDEGLIRENHWKYTARRNDYITLIKSKNIIPYAGDVTISYERHSTKMLDWDNLGASFKCWGDALEKAGVIKDDSPKTIREWRTQNVKVDSFSKIKTRIVIDPFQLPETYYTIKPRNGLPYGTIMDYTKEDLIKRIKRRDIISFKDIDGELESGNWEIVRVRVDEI